MESYSLLELSLLCIVIWSGLFSSHLFHYQHPRLGVYQQNISARNQLVDCDQSPHRLLPFCWERNEFSDIEEVYFYQFC
uniref:Putative secreted protein n=1 Tax=Panstrongylus lignarius TaxID=156445 RepID=A0A224Y5C1_9HEMI